MPPDTPVKRRPSTNSTPVPEFSIVRQLGEGSFYKIYLSAARSVIRISKKQWQATEETKILQRLTSRYANRLIRHWNDSGYMHFEMEYCPGGNLEAVILQRRQNPVEFDCFMDTEYLGHRQSIEEEEPTASPLLAATPARAADTSAIIDPFADNDCDTVTLNTSNILTDDESSSDNLATFSSPTLSHPRWVLILMYHVASGLRSIHSANIIHMDLKPANILRADDGRFVICDFNISRVGEGAVDLDGDPIYMAPEILRNKCFFSSDIFSLGLIYLSLCNPCRELPTSGDEYHRLRHNNFNGWNIDEIGRRMLERNHLKRCTATDVQGHFAQSIV